jgi:hypothetical protein
MVALLKHKITTRSINGRPAAASFEKKFYGRDFEGLGQERRVEVLDAWGMLSKDAKAAFSTIRAVRRKYLHFVSQSHDDLAQDSLKCLQHSEFLLVWLMGLSVRNSRIAFSPDFQQYLIDEGILNKEDSTNH